jgi:Ran GTPase-activating protein (RanGAP) involved in mRNA processing and transport
MGVGGAEALGEALSSNSSLAKLDLSLNEISAAGGRALSEGLRYNVALRTLILSDAYIFDAGEFYEYWS